MRDVPNELAARIESGAATLCHVWRVTRADGAMSGHTDHDRDLVMDGLVCRAASGWAVGAGDGEIGLAPGSLSAGGALGDDLTDAFEIGAQTGAVQGYVIDRPMRTRDAVEPLLAAFDMVGAERGGRVALIGREAAALAVALDALALPDEGGSLSRVRTLEARPAVARVRFIDEGADYQTGAVSVRSDGEGGGVDLDLPAVCGAGLARGLAGRALANGGAADRVTIGLGPLEALRLEAGDWVTVEGLDGDWRVERLDRGSSVKATLARQEYAGPVGSDVAWRLGDAPTAVGAPFFRLLDLPPLPGVEDDARPLAAVAGQPWRSMQIVGGAEPEALTLRGLASRSATVGVLLEPLGPGLLHRWDDLNTLEVRVEGAAPSSLGEAAVLGGANAVALETAAGWEIVQFRDAVLTAPGIWRLSGLLRGQQGTEVEMKAGAVAGAVVVVIDSALARLSLASGERGVPRIWRAGPEGAAPGGPGFSERIDTWRGVHDRPWSPAHLRAASVGGGLALRWIGRTRRGGDVWDGEVAAVDPQRFRVRVLDGTTVVRSFEVEGATATYSTAEITADFPTGPGAGVRIGVAQAGALWGWGAEATVPTAA